LERWSANTFKKFSFICYCKLTTYILLDSYFYNDNSQVAPINFFPRYTHAYTVFIHRRIVILLRFQNITGKRSFSIMVIVTHNQATEVNAFIWGSHTRRVDKMCERTSPRRIYLFKSFWWLGCKFISTSHFNKSTSHFTI